MGLKLIRVDEHNRLRIEDIENGVFIFQESKAIFRNKWNTFNSFMLKEKEGKELIKYLKTKFK